MGNGVVFLEDDDDLRAAVSDAVTTLSGRACFGLGSYSEMLGKRERVLHCSLAILDINLGADMPSGIDAYRWLRRHGFDGKIVFLTGHAQSHPLVAEAHRIGDVEVFEKPLPFQAFEEMLSGEVAC